GHDPRAVGKAHATVLADFEDRAHEVLVGAHPSSHPMHDDADAFFTHANMVSQVASLTQGLRNRTGPARPSDVRAASDCPPAPGVAGHRASDRANPGETARIFALPRPSSPAMRSGRPHRRRDTDPRAERYSSPSCRARAR